MPCPMVSYQDEKKKKPPAPQSSRGIPKKKEQCENKARQERQIMVRSSHPPVLSHISRQKLMHVILEILSRRAVLLNAPLVRRRGRGRGTTARGGGTAGSRGVHVDGVEEPVRIGEGAGVVGDVLLARVGQGAAGAVGVPDRGQASPVAAEGGVLSHVSHRALSSHLSPGQRWMGWVDRGECLQ